MRLPSGRASMGDLPRVDQPCAETPERETELPAAEGRNWPSGFALARIAIVTALGSVYVGFGEAAPSFDSRYRAFPENQPSPFGGQRIYGKRRASIPLCVS